jgi:hypothetical protein
LGNVGLMEGLWLVQEDGGEGERDQKGALLGRVAAASYQCLLHE